MKFNSSSWFPLKNFTRSPCHFDWMLGVTRFRGVRDFLDPMRTIRPNETVLWNRTLDANISLDTYRRVRASRDPDAVGKCRRLGLPLDARV